MRFLIVIFLALLALNINATVVAYDIRYAVFPITEDNWQYATQVDGEPTPSPGTNESYEVLNLTPGTQYYFGIKYVNENGTWSALATVAARTLDLAEPSPSPSPEISSTPTSTVTGSGGGSGTVSTPIVKPTFIPLPIDLPQPKSGNISKEATAIIIMGAAGISLAGLWLVVFK